MPFPNKNTQFQKGQSGNPNGYSNGRRQIDDIRALIQEMGLTRKISGVFLKKVLEGDARFMQMFLDRHDGRPTEAKGETGQDSEVMTGTRQILLSITQPEPTPEPPAKKPRQTKAKKSRK